MRVLSTRDVHQLLELNVFSAKMNMGFGKLYVLDSSNATIDVFKAVPELDDVDTAELFRFPTPFVLLVYNNFRSFNFFQPLIKCII